MKLYVAQSMINKTCEALQTLQRVRKAQRLMADAKGISRYQYRIEGFRSKKERNDFYEKLLG